MAGYLLQESIFRNKKSSTLLISQRLPMFGLPLSWEVLEPNWQPDRSTLLLCRNPSNSLTNRALKTGISEK